MMGANHAISGAAAWVAATAVVPALQTGTVAGTIPLVTGLYAQPPAVVLGGAIIAAGAALLPDSDHHSATIAHSVPVLGGIASSTLGAAAGGHRKGAHTLHAAAIVLGLSMLLHFAMWDTHTWMGTVCIGAGIATMALTAFASKVIRSIGFINSWPKAWLAGAATGFTVMVLLPGDQTWLPVAITLGFLVHLLGDMLTVGGIAPLYPFIPKPPLWWQSTPVLKSMWQRNGYMGVPVLGPTGGIREWALGGALTLYVGYIAIVVALSAFGVSLTSLLG